MWELDQTVKSLLWSSWWDFFVVGGDGGGENNSCDLKKKFFKKFKKYFFEKLYKSKSYLHFVFDWSLSLIEFLCVGYNCWCLMLKFFQKSILYFETIFQNGSSAKIWCLVRHQVLLRLRSHHPLWMMIFLRRLKKRSVKNLSDKISVWRSLKFPYRHVHFLRKKLRNF